MISKSKDHNENYLAKVIVVKNLRPVKGADRLLVFTVDGRDIVTSNATQEGQVSLYFSSGSQLNSEFLSKNNDFNPKLGLNADPESPGGFFEEKGRVKPIKLRGQKSDGYVVPITSLEPIIGTKYKELEKHIGEEFDAIGDFILVKKYIQPSTKGPAGEPKSRDTSLKKHRSRVIEKQFHFHYDTAHLDKNLHRLEPDDIISISWKLHGTSFISSKVLCKRELSRTERFFKWVWRIPWILNP